MKQGDQYLVLDLTYTVQAVQQSRVDVSVEDAYGNYLGTKSLSPEVLSKWPRIPTKPKMRVV